MPKGKQRTVRPASTEPFIDVAYSSRHATVQVRGGTSPQNTVEAEVDLHISDEQHEGKSEVTALWSVERIEWQGNQLPRISKPYPSPQPLTFASDEIESFAMALYEAVKLAKRRGYLPSRSDG